MATYTAMRPAAPRAARAGPSSGANASMTAAAIRPTWRPDMARRCASPASANRARTAPGTSSRSASKRARAIGRVSGGSRLARRRETRARARARKSRTGLPRSGRADRDSPADCSRPRTIPSLAGRRGHFVRAPIRIHSPRTETRLPAARSSGLRSSRTTSPSTAHVRPVRASMIATSRSVRRAADPVSRCSRVSPSIRTRSPVSSSVAHADRARPAAEVPSAQPAAKAPASARITKPESSRGRRRRIAARAISRVARRLTAAGTAVSACPASMYGKRSPRPHPTSAGIERVRRGGTRRGLAPAGRVRAPRTPRRGRHGSGGAYGASSDPHEGRPGRPAAFRR